MGARFSVLVQTGPGAYPASCTMGTVSSPGVKRPGRGDDRSPTSKRGGNKRVGLYLYSPSGPSWPVIGRTITFLRPNIVATIVNQLKRLLALICRRLEAIRRKFHCHSQFKKPLMKGRKCWVRGLSVGNRVGSRQREIKSV